MRDAVAFFVSIVAYSIAGTFAFMGVQAIAQGSPIVGIL